MWLVTDSKLKPSREMVVATLKKIEKMKAETLSELSNPFKAAREKYETVIDLECAKYKITDFIEVD